MFSLFLCQRRQRIYETCSDVQILTRAAMPCQMRIDCNEGAKVPSGQYCVSVTVKTSMLFTLRQTSRGFALWKLLYAPRETQNYLFSGHTFKVTVRLFFFNLACESWLRRAIELFTVCLWIFSMQRTAGWKSDVTIKERASRAHTFETAFEFSRELKDARVNAYAHHVLSRPVRLSHEPPLRSEFISDCQLFGSEPSLIMRILHPASLRCVQRPLCSPEYMKAKLQEIQPFSIKPSLADYY